MSISNALVNNNSYNLDINRALVVNTGWTDAARKAAELTRKAHAASIKADNSEGNPLVRSQSALYHSQLSIDALSKNHLGDRNLDISYLHKNSHEDHKRRENELGLGLFEDRTSRVLHKEAAKLHKQAEKAHLEADDLKPAVTKGAQELTAKAGSNVNKHKEAADAHGIAADYHEEHGNDAEKEYHKNMTNYHRSRVNQY